MGLFSCSESDQQPAPDFIPKNFKKSFSDINSPVVFIDEAQNNLHTIKGRYKPFYQVLTSDGYKVEASKKKFTLEHLKQADILVIVNALGQNRRDYIPPFVDAFEPEEIAAVKQWVSQGGSLFFVADHTPFPKISEKLSTAFGFDFNNGHVAVTTFHINNNSLMEHAITKGIPASLNDNQLGVFATPIGQETLQRVPYSERIVKVKAFGGSAFQIPENGQSLLVLGKGTTSLVPEIPFQVNAQTPRISMEGWSRGAVLKFGEGRVAMFSDGMMFTSQLVVSTGEKRGMPSVGAEQNEQFLLNVMHWLSKKI
jgi:hypothetical protein